MIKSQKGIEGLTTEELLAALFSSPEFKSQQIPATHSRLHKAVDEIKRWHPEVFGRFVFARTDPCPHCRLLEDALFYLQNAGCIDAPNLYFDIHAINPTFKNSKGARLLSNLSKDDRGKINKAAKDLSIILIKGGSLNGKRS